MVDRIEVMEEIGLRPRRLGAKGSRSTRVEDRVRRRRRTGQSRFNWPCSSIARLVEPESFVANDAGAVACDREGCIVAFQPLVPDWKLPFRSRLLESARARDDNGSERTANRTTAPAVLPSGRARIALSR